MSRLRSTLAKLERMTGEPPPPPEPDPEPWRSAFVEAFRTLTREQKDWVRFAMCGFTTPEPGVEYDPNTLHLWPPGMLPPWAFDPPPAPPDWLPGLLTRLGLPPMPVLREWGERGLLLRGLER